MGLLSKRGDCFENGFSGARLGRIEREKVKDIAHEQVLIVEDDLELGKMMADYLAQEGYRVDRARDGAAGLNLWRTARPDLVIVDWMLPTISGLDIIKEVRMAGQTPILMVTARGEDPDVVVGLELGADDYLVKPVSLRQLSARVRAILRRSRPGTGVTDVAEIGALRVDFLAQTVSVEGNEVPLTSMEFKILAVLARHPNRVFSRLQLMEASLGEYYEGYERTIDSHVSRIRTKIGLKSVVQTVYGSGYKLVPQGG